MLYLYLLGQNCLHLTFKSYQSSKTYSREYEKLPNIVVYACKNITEQETPQCDETRFSTIQPSIDVTGIRNERWQLRMMPLLWLHWLVIT